jgi:hypothetical protein
MILELCWTDNCRGRGDEQLYIMHAYDALSRKTFCGVNIQEIGESGTIDRVGCKRCSKSLMKKESLNEK